MPTGPSREGSRGGGTGAPGDGHRPFVGYTFLLPYCPRHPSQRSPGDRGIVLSDRRSVRPTPSYMLQRYKNPSARTLPNRTLEWTNDLESLVFTWDLAIDLCTNFLPPEVSHRSHLGAGLFHFRRAVGHSTSGPPACKVKFSLTDITAPIYGAALQDPLPTKCC